jgi:hypothetical protein
MKLGRFKKELRKAIRRSFPSSHVEIKLEREFVNCLTIRFSRRWSLIRGIDESDSIYQEFRIFGWKNIDSEIPFDILRKDGEMSEKLSLGDGWGNYGSGSIYLENSFSGIRKQLDIVYNYNMKGSAMDMIGYIGNYFNELKVAISTAKVRGMFAYYKERGRFYF